MFKYYTYNDIINGGEHDFEVETSRDYLVGRFGFKTIKAVENRLEHGDKDYVKLMLDNRREIFTITYTKDLTKCNICGKMFDDYDNYEPYVCDKCFDEHFGYCDNCGEVFAYHRNMVNGKGVMCGKCLSQIKAEDWRR